MELKRFVHVPDLNSSLKFFIESKSIDLMRTQKRRRRSGQRQDFSRVKDFIH